MSFQYINTFKKKPIDPADIVFKLYMQDEQATINNIVEKLAEMERFDILSRSQKQLLKLSKAFMVVDSGYQSNSSDDKQVISYTKCLLKGLPPALCKKFVHRDKKDPNKPSKQKLRPSVPIDRVNSGDNMTLFITYTEDGQLTSSSIKYYVDSWIDMPNVQVVTLNDSKNEMCENPEQFVRNCFEKVIFKL